MPVFSRAFWLHVLLISLKKISFSDLCLVNLFEEFQGKKGLFFTFLDVFALFFDFFCFNFPEKALSSLWAPSSPVTIPLESECAGHKYLEDPNNNCPANSAGLLPCFFKSPSTFWHETVDSFHSLFPWQLSLRDQQGFSRRQSAAVESLFTAGLKLWYSLTASSPFFHVYFHPSHQDVHNCSLHGDAVGRVTDWTFLNAAIIYYEKQWQIPCCLWSVAGGKYYTLTLKNIQVWKGLNTVEVHFQKYASRLIRRIILCANQCLLVQRPHNEVRQAARPPSTGW